MSAHTCSLTINEVVRDCSEQPVCTWGVCPMTRCRAPMESSVMCSLAHVIILS